MYNQKIHLHFVGIGGVGMAGIAEIVSNLGYQVSGSDMRRNGLVEHLEKLGCEVFLEHSGANIGESITAVVKSSAIPASNPELLKAKELGLPIISRAEMLAELMRMKYGVAVAGSHGKTTTTSMCAAILSDIGLDPTVVVGGRVLNQATGATLGMGPYFVAEADESDGSFCLLSPAIAIVTNIDREHMGHYGTFEALQDSFKSFLGRLPFYGLIIACIDNEIVTKIVSTLDKRVLTYGFSENAYVRAHSLRFQGGSTTFTLAINGEDVNDLRLPLAGAHMVSNALAAIAVAIELGAFPEEVISALEKFPGVARRTELIGRAGGITFFDDYGHHPTEIRATLAAMRSNHLENENSKLHVLFEPHRYSRTKEIFSDFTSSFVDADVVNVSEIYSAGEEPIAGVNGEALVASLDHPNAHYFANFKSEIGEIMSSVKPGDVVLTLGAGAIGSLGADLLQYASKNAK